MPISVPTAEEFAALERRVAALEGGSQPDPPSGSGTQAKPIFSLIEKFGVNTFSSMDENNVWGSWPADYRPETVIAALKFITGNTRFCLGIREYHYKGREEFQAPWLEEINAAFPDARVTLCVGANGSPDDVPSMVKMTADFYEGLNEPNTNFGSGEVPYTQTQNIQNAVWGTAIQQDMVMGPSIVAGMPGAGGWITGYCGVAMDDLNRTMFIGNAHYYPPHCPDLIGDGTSLAEYVGELWTAYAQHPIAITEFHPSLYNADGHQPTENWDGNRDAYYTLLALFRAVKCGVVGLWWYALFDYGTTYKCGLFPTDDKNPRPAAVALKHLCAICDDQGNDRYTFAPDMLDVTVSGLTNRCDWDLYQASDRRFLLLLWKSAPELGGEVTQVNLSFAQAVSLKEFNPLVSANPFATRSATTNYTSALDASCRVLEITI